MGVYVHLSKSEKSYMLKAVYSLGGYVMPESDFRQADSLCSPIPSFSRHLPIENGRSWHLY